VPQILMVVMLLFAGGWIGLTEHHGWFTVLVLVGIFFGLGWETHKSAYFWKISMGSDS
jgi:hypothetical protein